MVFASSAVSKSQSSSRIERMDFFMSDSIRWIHAAGLLPSLIHEQLVLHAVHESLPACLDDIFADADRPPLILAVSRFDQHARLRGGAFLAADDAHLVIGQPQCLERGIRIDQRGAEGVV